jgi:hypothetical protein
MIRHGLAMILGIFLFSTLAWGQANVNETRKPLLFMWIR